MWALEYILMLPLAISMSSLEKYLFKFFVYFLNWVIWFLLSSDRISLYILDINCLWDTCFANIFSHSIGYFCNSSLPLMWTVVWIKYLRLNTWILDWCEDGMRLNWPDSFCLLPLEALSWHCTSLTTSLDTHCLHNPVSTWRRDQKGLGFHPSLPRHHSYKQNHLGPSWKPRHQLNSREWLHSMSHETEQLFIKST